MKTEIVVTAIIYLVALLIYLIPTIIGLRKRNSLAIIAINVFLGWTFIGWVGSLIWAISSKSK